jgi:two-component system chemotaxis response regulator CheB
MIRVLVAEDSHTVRLLLVMLLESDPEIEVVGQVADGATAVDSARLLRPDVITMDIHMPGLDGLEATARIMNETPTPIVVVSTAVSAQDVASSFGAMKAGALVALPKPGAGGDPASDADRRMFVATVKAMSKVKVVRRWSAGAGSARDRGAPPERQGTSQSPTHRHQNPATEIIPTRSTHSARPPVALVAIAASTGGPTALQQVLSELPSDFPVPIVMVQHIARGFLPGFATWLDNECRLRVKVADSGESLDAGTVYVAPDDRHLAVTSGRRVSLLETPAVGGFCPSATVLFEAAANAYGASLAAVILTGMGSDGVKGLRQVQSRGGHVIAQDEATSLIYGMPGEAVAAGVVSVSLPLDRIAAHLQRLNEV